MNSLLYPKNYQLEKRQLVLLWMAEDLLQYQKGTRKEDVGKKYFHALASRLLFQHFDPDESYITIYGCLHDLALFISNGFYSNVGQ